MKKGGLGDTSPRMDEGRIMQEQLPRMPEQRITISFNLSYLRAFIPVELSHLESDWYFA